VSLYPHIMRPSAFSLALVAVCLCVVTKDSEARPNTSMTRIQEVLRTLMSGGKPVMKKSYTGRADDRSRFYIVPTSELLNAEYGPLPSDSEGDNDMMHFVKRGGAVGTDGTILWLVQRGAEDNPTNNY